MTTFTTIIALVPILLSTGTGSDVAKPMTLPAVGGMLAELISLFMVPCVYCLVKETKWRMVWNDPTSNGRKRARSLLHFRRILTATTKR